MQLARLGFPDRGVGSRTTDRGSRLRAGAIDHGGRDVHHAQVWGPGPHAQDLEDCDPAHAGEHAVSAGVRVAMTTRKHAMMAQAGTRESSIVS